jgi:hypothetical protein
MLCLEQLKLQENQFSEWFWRKREEGVLFGRLFIYTKTTQSVCGTLNTVSEDNRPRNRVFGTLGHITLHDCANEKQFRRFISGVKGLTSANATRC